MYIVVPDEVRLTTAAAKRIASVEVTSAQALGARIGMTVQAPAVYDGTRLWTGQSCLDFLQSLTRPEWLASITGPQNGTNSGEPAEEVAVPTCGFRRSRDGNGKVRQTG